MSQPAAPLFRLALRDAHAAAGAQFHVRDSWELPAHYGDLQAEHAALRSATAVFDRSHRSRIMVSGTDASVALGRVFAGDLAALEEGRAARTVALDDAGHIRDLPLVVRTGAISFLVSGEPGQGAETIARLQRATAADFDARIEDRTLTTCSLAVAGPAAETVIREHISDALPAALETLHAVAFEFHGFRALAVRTSDTGEDGFEFVLAPASALHLLETLSAAGTRLAGDVAHNIARLEACIPAFAPDLEGALTPAEADLDALLGIAGTAAGRILSALVMEHEAPAGTAVMAGREAVGDLRSCARSLSLDAIIGLAVIDSHYAFPGAALTVAGHPASVAAKPFYRRRRES